MMVECDLTATTLAISLVLMWSVERRSLAAACRSLVMPTVLDCETERK